MPCISDCSAANRPLANLSTHITHRNHMTAEQVSVGLTYEVLVSDKLVPVTLTKVCEWGGWYGTNLATGNAVRIKTAGRLRKQLDGEQRIEDNIIHTQTKEAAMPTTTPAQRAKRAAKRTAKTTET